MQIPSRPEADATSGESLSLSLATPDGGEWRLNLSPGMDRFVGHYARLPGIAPPGGLIDYKAGACT
jgi:hypothetical protein